jgi:nucleoside-diphosphate-sugar epimerase
MMDSTASALSSKRILVTGASGMIGAHLVRRLVKLGNKPFVLLRGRNEIRLHEVMSQVTRIHGDMSEPESIEQAIHTVSPEIVYHLASTYFNPPTLPAHTHVAVNLVGTQAIFESLREKPDVKIIYAGSAAVYQQGSGIRETAPLLPASIYGASKAACTVFTQAYARRYGMSICELRFFTPFGPWEKPGRLIPYIILKILSEEEIEIGEGSQQRDFLYIDDAIDALLLAGTKSLAPGLVLNVCSGVGRSIRSVAETIIDIMGRPARLKVGARSTRPDEIWEISGDYTAARNMLGWSPRIDFQEGLRRTIAWCADNKCVAQQLP